MCSVVSCMCVVNMHGTGCSVCDNEHVLVGNMLLCVVHIYVPANSYFELVCTELLIYSL